MFFRGSRARTNVLNSFIELDGFSSARYLAISVRLRDSVIKAAKQKPMYLKCAHPDCTSDFDYGQGRLFRFQESSTQQQQPSHWHAVKHYWLCSRCCETHTIEFQKGTGVLLMEKLEKLAGAQPCYYVLRAEVFSAPAAALPRLTRTRARQRKKKNADLTAAAGSVVEVLESRNVERRG